MSGPKDIRAGIGPPPALARPTTAGEGVGVNVPGTMWRGKSVRFTPLSNEESLEVLPANSERLTEELRLIKWRLLAMQRTANKPRSNIFMVASALPGDGKSFIAWNLARSLSADQDHEVILIDGDFRKPHLTRTFGLENEPGFLEVMSGKSALADVGHPIGNSKFVFIPAGTDNERANERLASKRTRELFDTIFTSKNGRIVVFDSAPILRASESQVLAHLVGRVVLVVRANSTPKKALEQAVNVLGGPDNCALLLNDVDAPPMARYSLGGYGYGYGNKYGK